MKKILKNPLAALVGSLALCAAGASLVYSQTPANPYDFEKKAYKSDGTPWTGPVAIGDIITYVLSYKPGSSPSGPVTIDDTLSPNLSYVGPTTGPGWTWSSSPYSVGNHEKYSSTGFGPGGGGSVTLSVSGSPAVAAGTGDGTLPIPIVSLNKIFGIFHGAGNAGLAKVDCWDLVTLAKCGTAQPNAVSGFIETPISPLAVVRGTRIYFPGYLPSGKTATIGCYDGSTQSACPDTTLPDTVPNIGSIAGIVEDASGRMFIAVGNKLYCRQVSGTSVGNCGAPWTGSGVSIVTPAATPPAATPTDAFNRMDILMEHGTAPSRVYIHAGKARVQCVDINTAATCSSWNAAGVQLDASTSSHNALSSLPLSGGSGDGGVCLWNSTGNSLGCVTNTGAPTTQTLTPNNINKAFVATYRFLNSGVTLFPEHFGTGPKCYIYNGTTATPCPGFVSQQPTGGTQYGFALDPLNPGKCMLSLGDQNLMWRFDYRTGQIGCGAGSTTPDVKVDSCLGKGTSQQFHWTAVTTTTPGAAGTLTVTDGTNTHTFTVSGGNIGAIPATFTPGAPLTFTFTPNASSPSKIDLHVAYVPDGGQQICYKAKVTKCGPVFNEAIFKATVGGASVSTPKKVDLGNATGPQCGPVDPPPPQTACLTGKMDVVCGPTAGTHTVTFYPTGAGGVVPTSVAIIPPAGITLIPNKPSYSVVGGAVSVTIAGATAGRSIALQVQGMTKGAGSQAGLDLCCNGEIKIDIPKDLTCDQPPIDVAIKKTGGTSPPPDVPHYSFDLAMTNEGRAFTAAAGQLVVKEQVPPGMNFTSVTPTAGWTCSPAPPITGPATITCSYAGGPVAAGPGTSIGGVKIVALNTNPVPYAPVENCAEIGLSAGSNLGETTLANNKNCVTVTKPPRPVSVSIAKTCDPISAPVNAPGPFAIQCRIVVTAPPGATPAVIKVTENLVDVDPNRNPKGQIISMSSTTPGWVFPSGLPVPPNQDVYPQISGADLIAAGGSSTINVTVTVPTDVNSIPEHKNCVLANGLDANGQVVSASQKICVPLSVNIGPALPLPQYTSTKTCAPVAVNGVITCQVSFNLNGAPVPATIEMTDTLYSWGTAAAGAQTTTANSTEPWTYTPSLSVAANTPFVATLAGSSLPSNGQSTITMQVQVPPGTKSGDLQNCVVFALKDASGAIIPPGPVQPRTCAWLNGHDPQTQQTTGFRVRKIVVNPNPAFGLPNVTFPVNYNCGSGIAGTLPIQDGLVQSLHHLPTNTTCTITEGAPSTTVGLCPQGQSPSWTTAYAPSATFVANHQTITITNTLTCNPAAPAVINTHTGGGSTPVILPPVRLCPVGQQRDRSGNCVPIQRQCGPNQHIENGRCVDDEQPRSSSCAAPLIRNNAGACVCPPGTTRDGVNCVRQIACNPPARLTSAGVCQCPEGMAATRDGCTPRTQDPKPETVTPRPRTQDPKPETVTQPKPRVETPTPTPRPKPEPVVTPAKPKEPRESVVQQTKTKAKALVEKVKEKVSPKPKPQEPAKAR